MTFGQKPNHEIDDAVKELKQLLRNQPSPLDALKIALSRANEIYRHLGGAYKGGMRKHTALFQAFTDEINNLTKEIGNTEQIAYLKILALNEFLSDQDSEHLPKLLEPIIQYLSTHLGPFPEQLKPSLNEEKKRLVAYELQSLTVDPDRTDHRRKD